MIENADTPAEHEAMARYYRMKAADAMSLAQEHREMAKRYTGVSMPMRDAMRKHCEKIAKRNEEIAAQCALAKGEDAAAK